MLNSAEHDLLILISTKISKRSDRNAKNVIFPANKCYNANNYWYFNSYEQKKSCSAELSMKTFYNLGARSGICQEILWLVREF